MLMNKGNKIRHTVNNRNVSLRSKAGLVATGLFALAIAYLTLSAPDQISVGGAISDKIYHFLAFTILVIPVAIFNPRALAWVLPASLLFGGAIELIQPHVGRQGEWLDFWADFAGVVFGAGLGLILNFKCFPKRIVA